MNIEAEINEPLAAEVQEQNDLLRSHSKGLQDFLAKAENLKTCLAQLGEIGTQRTSAAAAKLVRQLDEFEPSVTMIGQVKAGKTSLVNAMVGLPELLPADVNPWTSVVTSLHLSPTPFKNGNSALFKFFDETQWDRLLEKGGRLGELASRAGADDELVNVRRQIEQMREKSKARLGRRFELLLGQEHDYGYFDRELIERYVCLGDGFDGEDGGSDTQGRFADITRSADLFMHRPEFETGFCIRDTPGVNDTFMMREQITINAIRESRLCVVVLSAHQALSSVDMALIRLISNIKSREVIIFVNRMDELSEPAKQVPEIRASIQKTLADKQGPQDAQIIFGSALWANIALSSTLDSLPDDSADALLNWAEVEMQNIPTATTASELVWALSGIPKLQLALSERFAEGAGTELLDRVARSSINLASGIHASNRIVAPDSNVVQLEPAGKDEISDRFDQIEQQSKQSLKDDFDRLLASLQMRVDGSHQTFLERATASVIKHLERYGEGTVWTYDSAGLRVLLRSSYQIFGARAQKSANKIYSTTAAEIHDVYIRAFGSLGIEFSVEPPVAPRVPPPVFLGQTIALDLQGSWWKSWWQRRRGFEAYATNFYEMIMAETDPIVDELKNGDANTLHADAELLLTQFLTQQREIITGIVEQMGKGQEDLKSLLAVHSHDDRKSVIEKSLKTFQKYVA